MIGQNLEISMQNSSQLETVTCIFGHTSAANKLFDRPDWWCGLPGAFAWYQCPECGLRFLSPRPTLEHIADYYPDSYAAYRPAIDDEPFALMRWKRRRNLQKHLESLHKWTARNGRLLDVGCATGNYLVEAQKAGWNVKGVEIQADAASYARQRFNLDVFTGDLLDNPFPSNTFDVITMWDVLEHTHNPLAILQEAHQLLTQNGVVIFSIPDPHSKEANSFSKAWIGYDAPRHLFLFEGQSLSMLLKECGFELLETDHFLANYHTWIASYQTYLKTGRQLKLLDRLFMPFMSLPIWSTLTSPYFNWLNKNGRGTVMTVFARVI